MTPPPPFSVGFGYDVHEFARGRQLWLGGVRIDFDRGLVGHSDADVLLHAICDALLGAGGLRDIGSYFPNTDPAWAGADSRAFLRAVVARIGEGGWIVGNIDCTLIAEAPRMAPHVDAMRANIAADCGIEPARVAVKATTNERLGFIGREEGIAAMAVALLYKA